MTASDERGSKEFLGVGRMAEKVSQRNGVKLFPTREIRLVRPIENGIASPKCSEYVHCLYVQFCSILVNYGLTSCCERNDALRVRTIPRCNPPHHIKVYFRPWIPRW